MLLIDFGDGIVRELTDMNEKENQERRDWFKTHACEGFVQEMSVIPVANWELATRYTSIGDIYTVRCLLCKEEKDITDYDCW
jgi:hypothetical protein